MGAIQPIAGALADKHGARPVLLTGIVVLALGTALTPFMHSGLGLVLSLGLLSAMGAGAGSFSVLIGAAAQRLPGEARGAASGVINAGGSFGQFVFAPLSQILIQGLGWMAAMWTLAGLTFAALPLIGLLTRPATPGATAIPTAQAPSATTQPAATASPDGLRQAVSTAMKNPSYLLLHLGFFTCGFHIAFLVTHLPSEVNLCGLPPSVASWMWYADIALAVLAALINLPIREAKIVVVTA